MRRKTRQRIAVELEFWKIACLCGVFFMAGFVGSAAGGGGLIAMPAMLVAGIPPDLTIGTYKLTVLAGTPASIATYARSGFVLWRLAAVGAPFAFLAGIAGSNTVLLIDNNVLGKVILFLLPLAIAVTLLPGGKTIVDAPRKPAPYGRTALLCSAIGFYEGFFGPGAGSFLILALHYGAGCGLVQASATAKVINVGAMFSAFLVFAFEDKILYSIGIPFGIACMTGHIVGAKVTMRIGPAYVRKMMVLVMLLLTGSLAWKQFCG